MLEYLTLLETLHHGLEVHAMQIMQNWLTTVYVGLLLDSKTYIHDLLSDVVINYSNRDVYRPAGMYDNNHRISSRDWGVTYK